MVIAAWDVKEWAAVLAPSVALLIGVATLIVNGERAERLRRRELHARALAAAIAYREMPFAIRRRHVDDPGAERIRLTSAFQEIQAELAVCEVLIAAEGQSKVTNCFREFVGTTRRIAGGAARDAWNSEPIRADADINMPELARQLSAIDIYRDRYRDAIQDAARSPLTRVRDAIEAADD